MAIRPEQVGNGAHGNGRIGRYGAHGIGAETGKARPPTATLRPVLQCRYIIGKMNVASATRIAPDV